MVATLDDPAFGRALLALSENAVICYDRAGVVTFWSARAEQLYGYMAGELLGKSIQTLTPPDCHGDLAELFDRLERDGRVAHFETVRVRRDGARVSILLSAAPILSPDRRITGAVVVHRDQDYYVSGESAVRRLAAIVESSDDAIISKDLNGIVTSWNAAAERMYGYAAQEMLGESIRRIIPQDRKQEEYDVLERIRRGERVHHFETVRQRKDGALVPISLTVSPILDRAGTVVGASKIARDITERLRLEADATREALITRRLGEMGTLLASTLERDTVVRNVLSTSTELTGAQIGAFFYDDQDVTSDRGDVHTLPGVSTNLFDALRRIAGASLFAPTFNGEEPVRIDDLAADCRFGIEGRDTGAAPPLRSYLAVPVKTASGDVLGGLFFGHAEPGIFTAHEQQLAGGLAATASVALQNAQLYIEAREANRMKDEFLAVLSHELRTPLNAIVGYTRLLRAGVLTGEKAARGLETLERNAAALTQIVEDVLDVSGIVAGKIRLDVQPVELSLVVHNAVATVQPAADAKEVRLQTIIDPRVGPVSGDPDRLQQVVWNLLSNAVKFTPKRGRVQVRLERVNSHVEIVVSDTGVGIPTQFLPHVFERFRQAETGSSRKTGGLGLGLAIVRHIIEMHGGTVHAASAGEGQGATFRVRLPLMIVQPERFDERREHPRSDRRRQMASLGDLQGVRVLAVDDEPDALVLLRAVLESAGAEVVTVSSALAALDRLEAVRPHALVVDLGMPEMDGYTLIARIRASEDPQVRDVPAAALTAFARSEDRTKALRCGFEMHLAKPVDPGELVASVSTLVRRTRGSSGSR